MSTFAYALISPGGDLQWWDLAQAGYVERMVRGKIPALTTVTLYGALRLLVSDIALLYPDDYEAAPTAGRVISELSRGRIDQPWRGYVAVVEYTRDPVTGELGWPTEMSDDHFLAVEQSIERARR